MNFQQEIERIKRKLFFLDRTTQTIIQDEVTSLDELTDVTIYEPSNGQVLTYNSITGEWENEDATATGDENIDGGVADSIYLVTQLADGGPA